MNEAGTIAGVLSGNNAIKVEIGIDSKSAIIFGITLFISVLLVVIISKKI